METMEVTETLEHGSGNTANSSIFAEKKEANKQDEEDLAQLGYTAELQRKFSLLSLASLGFVVCTSWSAVMGTMAIGLSQGGMVTIFWGFILVCVFLGASAMMLGELASAFPSAGGQHQYVFELCSPRFARAASYFTAWLSALAWLLCSGKHEALWKVSRAVKCCTDS